MSGRLFAALLVVLGIAAVLGAAFGEEYKLLVLAGLAAVGAAATLARAWLLRGLLRALGQLHPDWLSTALTYYEDLEVRPELADRLSEPLPLVPIRRGEERYAYPRATAAIMWGLAGFSTACAFLPFALLLIEHPSSRPWPEGWELVLMFAAMAACCTYVAYRTPMEIRVTDSSISLWIRGRERRRLAWTDIEIARRRQLGQYLVLSGRGVTIRIGETIEQYGRLLNIVASRVELGRSAA